MSIYRGAGGSGDATNDATVSQVQTYASQAATSATNAAASATAAAASASGASTSAALATSAKNDSQAIATTVAGYVAGALASEAAASDSATDAAASAAAAAISEGGASGSASDALDSANTATTQASNAATSATNSANSAASALAIYGNTTAMNTAVTNAGNSATAAATSATNAATSASNASSSASAASSSASAASTSASAAATSAGNAATSASNASSSASAASSSASSASTSASTATTQASNASTSATNASNSASTATTQAGIATTGATTATTQAGIATTQAGIATTGATTATTQAGIATTQASNASTSATNAASSETNSLANRNAAATSATAASTSASAAATSATSSATSASAAATSAAAASAVALGNEPVRHSVRPSLLLDFANTKQLDPRITFTRASTATFYDGKTTAKAEENLILQSENFTSSWSQSFVTIAGNATTAPDGTITADTITPTATNNSFSIFQQFTCPDAVQTHSFYVKANGYTKVLLRESNAGGKYVSFDLSTASILASANATGTITSVGNGWFRCTMTITYTGTTRISIYILSPSYTTGESSIFTADGTSGIYVWGAQAEGRSAVSAYTVTTTQPITNYIPALQTAASGVARFDHNPTTGESLGLLIEEQRVNLQTYSEQFESVWTRNGTSVSANATIAPDGIQTADKIIANATTSFHLIQGVAVTGTGSHTMSVYAKAGEYTRFAIRESNTTGHGALFDLLAGTVLTTNGGAVATITPVGNGWYRCTATVTWGTLQSFGMTLATNTNTTNLLESFTGNGFAGIYIWGAQLEAGAFATSYIPTVASQVTRSPDAASLTGTNFSNWYRQDEGTVYVEGSPKFSSLGGLWGLGSGTSTNSMYLARSGTNILTYGYVNSAAQWVISIASSTNPVKSAFSYATNNIQHTVNAGTVVTDTTAVIPTTSMDILYIGSFWANQGYSANGAIKKLAYYPKSLTSAELQGLSTV